MDITKREADRVSAWSTQNDTFLETPTQCRLLFDRRRLVERYFTLIYYCTAVPGSSDKRQAAGTGTAWGYCGKGYSVLTGWELNDSCGPEAGGPKTVCLGAGQTKKTPPPTINSLIV